MVSFLASDQIQDESQTPRTERQRIFLKVNQTVCPSWKLAPPSICQFSHCQRGGRGWQDKNSVRSEHSVVGKPSETVPRRPSDQCCQAWCSTVQFVLSGYESHSSRAHYSACTIAVYCFLLCRCLLLCVQRITTNPTCIPLKLICTSTHNLHVEAIPKPPALFKDVVTPIKRNREGCSRNPNKYISGTL